MQPSSSSPSPVRPRQIGIQAKVLLLTSVLVGYFIASQLWAVVRLHEATRLIEGQTQAVQDQNQVLAAETKLGEQLKLLQALTLTLGELRYWSVDLALTLLTESEQKARAAHKALAPLLTALTLTEPELIKALQPRITDYVNVMATAADAYTDSNRVLGNSLASQGQLKIASMMELLAGRLTSLEGETVTARTRLQKAADNVGVSGQTVIGKNQSLIHLTYAILIGAVLIGALSVIYLTRSVFRHFAGLIAALRRSAEETAAAAAQISADSQTLAEGTSQQAASLEETSASLEEMSSMFKSSAEAANKAKTIAGETRAAADTGTADMDEMKTAMNEIKTSSQNIAKIIQTIDEIAFQTNILALNAAVEAARAGEAGMGFAVVADEVRNLAQRSALSAKETADKIETAIGKSERGVQISAKVAANFDQITRKAREVDQYVAEIATATNEQTQGVTQVSLAVTQMDKVTQSNAANAEESASAAEELNAQAEAMQEAVAGLQRLVGGGTQASAASIPAPIHEAQGSKPAGRPAPHTGTRANTPSRANGNHKPTLQSSPLQASRRTPPGVANDDDFRSF